MTRKVVAKRGQSFLKNYRDMQLPVHEGDTEATISQAEQERLSRLLAISILARSMPRRLGVEADSSELAVDKKHSKRIAHVTMQLLRYWGAPPGGVSIQPDVQREAAMVDWPKWFLEHRTWLINRQIYIGTWCLKCSGDEMWAKSAITKLENEIKWLEHALR